uniref:Coenzyme Q-binding protein COQ10 n=1 Tax=Candidatus Kentrum sp. TC TaxID=2126339 RepID=A0A450ZSX5_9GAMM|nr:MAG: coenzyme Q-binding protein COQ10 [Candidatus Kentron sp. TC]VFK43218.1 MAG: coenzyme Q-binding protein COQ10 [Candidatus Kentron sp. TC]VFK56882.1 MAG: coenzyme Q-binding protein COQ10 [Candidatus Kentron sp. TC]
MSTHTTKQILPYPPEYVFDLVADVESYPEFLPFWRRAEIYARDENTYYTDQEIWMGVMQEHFRTKTVLNRSASIEVTSSEGFFQNLIIRWDFESAPNEGCKVIFTQSWKLRSFLKQQLVGLLLAENSRATINAFEKRAHDLHGVIHEIRHDHPVTTH